MRYLIGAKVDHLPVLFVAVGVAMMPVMAVLGCVRGRLRSVDLLSEGERSRTTERTRSQSAVVLHTVLCVVLRV